MIHRSLNVLVVAVAVLSLVCSGGGHADAVARANSAALSSVGARGARSIQALRHL